LVPVYIPPFKKKEKKEEKEMVWGLFGPVGAKSTPNTVVSRLGLMVAQI
jgi:hypothetical protein